ncbi:MAG TPA: hypothetical protein VM510_11000 [Caulifigura sp.]|nr:hypothetical protein [Caulifigura sp.]
MVRASFRIKELATSTGEIETKGNAGRFNVFPNDSKSVRPSWPGNQQKIRVTLLGMNPVEKCRHIRLPGEEAAAFDRIGARGGSKSKWSDLAPVGRDHHQPPWSVEAPRQAKDRSIIRLNFAELLRKLCRHLECLTCRFTFGTGSGGVARFGGPLIGEREVATRFEAGDRVGESGNALIEVADVGPKLFWRNGRSGPGHIVVFGEVPFQPDLVVPGSGDCGFDPSDISWIYCRRR